MRTSARAIIDRDGALLVLRYRDDRGDWYTLPGGGQRDGEGLVAAVAREVAEETGLRIRVGPLRFVRECIAPDGGRGLPPGFHQVEFYFACEVVGSVGSTDEPDSGQVGTEWCRIAELRDRCFFPPALLDALERGEPFGYLGVV
jgi:ADP-ribose pyrophosphatase YjhB (NUDIX family)